MSTTKEQLKNAIEEALDFEADKVVNPDEARERIATKFADAIDDFVVGRTVTVIGVQNGPNTTTGTIDE